MISASSERDDKETQAAVSLDNDRIVRPDDERLIRMALAADAYQGCDLLFRRYYQPLCSQAIRFAYDKAVAEDIVSDLFKTFWQKRIFERINYSYRAYLYRAVRLNSLLYLQREAKTTISVEQYLTEEFLIQASYPSDQVQFDELAEHIDKVILALSPSVRRVFLLSRFEGRKNQEIANELHISLKTVEAHLTKALTVFRKALSHE